MITNAICDLNYCGGPARAKKRVSLSLHEGSCAHKSFSGCRCMILLILMIVRQDTVVTQLVNGAIHTARMMNE